ncbi:MAG: membrane protein insertase YidC, partial [Alistipes sp.]|nr:membrane protein insertase YidC [Alistipes sp.]
MNKNTIIGIVLMVALFIGYGIFQANEIEKQEQIALAQKKKKEAEEAKIVALREAERKAEKAMTPEQRAERDSINRAAAELSKLNTHGETLLAALNGESQSVTLENDFMSVTFDNRGGKIADVTLKQHTRYADGERTEPIKMMVPGSASFGIDLHREGSAKAVKSNDYLFDTKVEELDNAQRVTMKLMVDPEAYIEYVYTLHNTGDASRDYLIDFTFNQHGIDKYLDRKNEIIMRWGNKSMKNERDFNVENNATTIAFYSLEDEESDEVGAGGKREHHRDLGWIALKQQYFTSA